MNAIKNKIQSGTEPISWFAVSLCYFKISGVVLKVFQYVDYHKTTLSPDDESLFVRVI